MCFKTSVTVFARLAQSVEHETLSSQEWSQGRGFEPHVGRITLPFHSFLSFIFFFGPLFSTEYTVNLHMYKTFGYRIFAIPRGVNFSTPNFEGELFERKRGGGGGGEFFFECFRFHSNKAKFRLSPKQSRFSQSLIRPIQYCYWCRRTQVFRDQARSSYLQAAFWSQPNLIDCKVYWILFLFYCEVKIIVVWNFCFHSLI